MGQKSVLVTYQVGQYRRDLHLLYPFSNIFYLKKCLNLNLFILNELKMKNFFLYSSDPPPKNTEFSDFKPW